ncbi:MAG TPA: hypothetical protein DDW50_00090 [Firmicutes bacterium]|nr:hypothetical protein [Bacillota bacterium]
MKWILSYFSQRAIPISWKFSTVIDGMEESNENKFTKMSLEFPFFDNIIFKPHSGMGILFYKFHPK